MFKEYDNLMFDLYGTLIDVRTDEHGAKYWKKWMKWLDKEGIKHPPYYRFRSDFWELDKASRVAALKEGKFKVPEIDIIPVYRELFERYGNGILPDELLERASYAFRESSRLYYRLFPGVEDFLKARRAEGKKLYLLSNAQATYTRPEIESLGLDKLLDDIYMSSDRLCMKPDKAFYDMLLDEKKLDRKRTVMMGDSFENDYQGAIDAGIAGIHLAGENHPGKFYINNL